MSNDALRVTVMRHGAVTGPAHVLRGKQDAPLSDLGWQQMRDSIALMPPFSAIFASPLARCRAFTEWFAQERQLPMNLHAGFAELDFGDWDGLTPAEVAARAPELFTRFQADPSGLAPPQGEPFDDFRWRVLSAFAQVTAQPTAGHQLIVTHAGVMRVLLSHVLDVNWQAVSRIALPPGGWFRVSLLQGCTPYLLHLNGEQCAT